jgi:hypothetical protein
MVTYDYTNVMYADIIFSAILIGLGIILWRFPDWRSPLLSCGVLYLSFAMLWHFA